MTYNAYGSEWVAPTFSNLVQINDGVVGTVGMAFWPDEADVAETVNDINTYQTFNRAAVRFDDGSGVQTFGLTASLDAAVVPTPSAALAGFGLMGLTALRRRRSL